MTDENTPKPNIPPSAFVPPRPRPGERDFPPADPPEELEPEAMIAALGGEVSHLRERVERLEAELRAGLDAVGRALAKQPAGGGPPPVEVQGGTLTGQSGMFANMSDAEREEYRRGLGFIR